MKTRLLVWTLLAAAPPGVLAQDRWPVAISAGAALLNVRHVAAGHTARLHGPAFGGEARIFAGPAVLELAYQEGTLWTIGDDGAERQVVEGRILAGLRPFSWFSITAGPHVRAYLTAAGTERWLFWEARTRLERRLVGRVSTHLELWQVFSAAVSVPTPFGHAAGGEAGVTLGLQRFPLWARLSYRLDHARLGGGSVRETYEGVYCLIGIGRR